MSSIRDAHITIKKKARKICKKKGDKRPKEIFEDATQKSLAASQVKIVNQSPDHCQDPKENRPGVDILHSIKHLNLFANEDSEGLDLISTNDLEAEDEILTCVENKSTHNSKSTKSHGGLESTLRKRRKIRKIINTAKTTITYLAEESDPIISKISMKLFNSSGMRILKTLIEKEESFPAPLANHEISPQMRSRMIDWMIEVCSIYKKGEDTYFHAVYLFDKYLSLTDKILDDTDIHLIGITCLFSASKYLDYQ